MEQDLYRRAAILVERKKFREAEIVLRELLAREPQNSEALDLYAEVKLQMGEPDAALEIITSAIGLSPERDFFFYRRARIHMRLHNFETAAADMETAISLNPRFAAHFALYALVLVNMQKNRKALEMADKSLELDPHNTLAMNARHIAYRQLNYREEAETAIIDALRQDPENELTHANKGWDLLEQKKPEEALTHFRESLRINPNYNYALAGIKLAMPAQNRLYRVVRRYVDWLQSQTTRNKNLRTIFFLLPLVSMLSLSLVSDSMGPYLAPLIFTLIAVFLLDVLYMPVVLFFMRRNPAQGKHLLSRKENNIALAAGICLFSGLAGLLGYLITLKHMMLVVYIVFISFLLPLTMLNALDRSRRRENIETGICAAMGIAAIIATAVTRNAENAFVTLYCLYIVYLRTMLPKWRR